LGIQLICYDRPGYGGSHRTPGRSVADAAEDVQAIATELNLGPFGVVGRSGGAPHALACAALLDGWVQSVATLVGLAPPDAAGLDWYDGMTHSNTTEFGQANRDDPRAIMAALNERAEIIRTRPHHMLDLLRDELTPQDRRIVDDFAIQRLLTDTYREALKHGPEGWIDDTLALRSPWGFRLTDIKVPVLIWHGADDVFSPVSHASWLASHIRGDRDDAEVDVILKRNAAHFTAVEVLPDILTWIKDTVRTAAGRQRALAYVAHAA
jgi:pimeloyl-ACP methyl ester carboxylesterase